MIDIPDPRTLPMEHRLHAAQAQLHRVGSALMTSDVGTEAYAGLMLDMTFLTELLDDLLRREQDARLDTAAWR